MVASIASNCCNFKIFFSIPYLISYITLEKNPKWIYKKQQRWRSLWIPKNLTFFISFFIKTFFAFSIHKPFGTFWNLTKEKREVKMAPWKLHSFKRWDCFFINLSNSADIFYLIWQHSFSMMITLLKIFGK